MKTNKQYKIQFRSNRRFKLIYFTILIHFAGIIAASLLLSIAHIGVAFISCMQTENNGSKFMRLKMVNWTYSIFSRSRCIHTSCQSQIYYTNNSHMIRQRVCLKWVFVLYSHLYIIVIRMHIKHVKCTWIIASSNSSDI